MSEKKKKTIFFVMCAAAAVPATVLFHGGDEQIDQWLPHVQNAEVRNVELRDYDGTLNLAELPRIKERLELHNIPDQTDLSGLKGPGPHTLQLDNLPMLTSLNGIRELIGEGGIREIRIGGCPKLSDWSALEGADFVRGLDITEEEKELILHGNAERLYHL